MNRYIIASVATRKILGSFVTKTEAKKAAAAMARSVEVVDMDSVTRPKNYYWI